MPSEYGAIALIIAVNLVLVKLIDQLYYTKRGNKYYNKE